MKVIRHLDNAGGIEVDFDPLNSKNKLLERFVRAIPEHNLILIRNIPKNKSKLVKMINRIGKTHIRPEGLYYTDPDAIEITRVTNQRDINGSKIGLFADLELCWHCNGTLRKDVKETTLILYCVKPGKKSHGVTGFCNTRKAYEDLPENVKKLIEKIKVRHSMKAFSNEIPTLHKGDGGYSLTQDDPEYEIFSGKNKNSKGKTAYVSELEDLYKPLVCTHPLYEKKSLYFIPSAITHWYHEEGIHFDSEKLWDFLYEHTFQEKYVYRHHWCSGDIIFNDQWYGMHNRTEVKGDRFLWRFCIDNSAII